MAARRAQKCLAGSPTSGDEPWCWIPRLGRGGGPLTGADEMLSLWRMWFRRARRLVLALLTAFAVGGAPTIVAAEPVPSCWVAPASEAVAVEFVPAAPVARHGRPLSARASVLRVIAVVRLYLSLQSLLL